jgi:hypothetical protein
MHVRGERDESSAEYARADERPGRGRWKRTSPENRNEPECHGPERNAPEAGREQKIERSPFDQEADGREDSDDDGNDDDCAVEREPCLGQLVRRLQRLADGEERRRRRKEADDEQLSEQP